MHDHTIALDRDRLWRGVILATIGHALWIAANPQFSYELSWDGINYNRQDSQGTRGTITFASRGVVGVFRDDHSRRIPWQQRTPYTLNSFFAGIPPNLMELAHEETLHYMLDTHNGQVSPVITAAFWSDEQQITAAEPWPSVLEHGGHMITIELMTTEAGIAAWQAQYRWNDAETRLFASLFTRCMRMEEPVAVTSEEWRFITSDGTQGVEDTHLLLEGLGFILP